MVEEGAGTHLHPDGMVIWLWKKGAKESIKSDSNRKGEIVFDCLSPDIKAVLR